MDRTVVALPRANGNAPKHYRALPHEEVGAAVGAIRGARYIHPSAALCVEMIALTAVRAGEALGARGDEIDVEAGRWIPASRIKAEREFSVPLSTGALGVLGRARVLSPESSLVFPSTTGGLLPRNAAGRVLRRAGVDSTVHGFRSSARSCMAESGVPAEVAEACLAHVPRSQVVQAYQRSDLLERCAEVLASAALHFVFPSRFPVLDMRTVGEIPADSHQPPNYTIPLWSQYAQSCAGRPLQGTA